MNRLLISYLFAACSGILMFLSMPSYNFGIFAWFGLVPLLLALKDKSSLQQYILINVTCIIWSFGTHIWYPAIFSGWGYLIMIGAGCFYGAFIKMGYDMQVRINRWYAIFAIPITFSVFEWLKTILPFTKTWWIEIISKSQWMIPETLQILSLTGFIGLSFLILLSNVVIAEIIKNQFSSKNMKIFTYSLFVLPVANFIFGTVIMNENDKQLKEQPITIGATVDLVNQDEEVLSLGSGQTAGDGYLADTYEMKEKIFEINEELSKQIMNEKRADFIVWGENEFMNLNDTQLTNDFRSLAKSLHTTIIADTVWETEDTMYDTAYMVDGTGEEIGRTPKIFTLWGEESYGFSPGPRDYDVYETAHGKVALAICWDRHDQSILRNYAKNGAQLATIPADDDFYGDKRFPYYAASDAVFRAVENHLAIGSGSTSGVAQVITPYGEMTAMSGVNQRQYIVGDTFTLDKQTFYTRFGDVFAYLFALIFLAMFIVSERNKRKM
ncbi:apolipoprotein N-acyltransferase [Ureibacillus xyleni]|uniref:Apolipoprotein N-acyltransferase n=1 Tax=Ureibacillus xyleni TaxID=614648 RepID=A0A285SE39_9BACL|nr:nitrilase-related carbon-nitrogen hydrolase [Ureibacillus xyleni]SOC05991.1 apolipoprotein N-acyltransferase [Ureibacillus xyleni]